jgi:hypothetical protein
LLDAKGPDYKLTPADMDGVPNELWNTFASRLAPNANAEKTQERIKASEEFKAIKKDIPNLIKEINSDIGLSNIINGTRGPGNEASFILDSSNAIALRAQNLMLSQTEDGKSVSMEQAIQIAKDDWFKLQQDKQTKGEFFKDGRFVTSASPAIREAAEIKEQLQATKIRDLSTSLYDSDYLADSEGRYSERVRYLGRQFGKTPSEIVAMARQQKGLPALEATNRELALSEMNPAQRARMASLGDATPLQMGLRAQISSGQVLQGSAKQRTISIGQQLISMGYGGIWQHPNFNYDTGYVKGGDQENSGHAGNSYHKYNEALDIGVQANGHQRLEQLYQYLLKNKQRFGITELFYDPDGTRGHPKGHGSHLHTAFGGGDEGKL